VARACKALDNGEGYVDASALAVLGGVSLGRIRNLMAGPGRIFETQGGRVAALTALRWLGGQPAFWDSIWREEAKVAAQGVSSVLAR
jgi:hypothetical protein